MTQEEMEEMIERRGRVIAETEALIERYRLFGGDINCVEVLKKLLELAR